MPLLLLFSLKKYYVLVNGGEKESQYQTGKFVIACSQLQ